MDEAKNGSEVMATLTYLSDIIGPRLTGSPALKRANEWTAERMRSYGLSNVHLEPYTIVAGWERGTAYARIIEPDNGRTLSLAAAGWAEHQRQSARRRGDFHRWGQGCLGQVQGEAQECHRAPGRSGSSTPDY